MPKAQKPQTSKPTEKLTPELQAKLDKANAEKKEANRKEREENFKKVAIRRANRIVKDISSLSNLTNRSNYDYTEEQVAKMFKLIEETTSDVKAKFAVKVKEKTTVTLSL